MSSQGQTPEEREADQRAYQEWAGGFGGDYIGKDKKNRWWEQRNQQYRDRRAEDLLTGRARGSILSGSAQEQEGQMAGLNTALIGYGQGLEQTGKDVAALRDVYRQRMEQGGTDPVSAAIMGQKGAAVTTAGRSMRQAGVKGGVAAKALGDVAAQKDAEIAQSLYGQARQSAQDFGRLTGNTLSGTIALMKGEQAGAEQLPQYNPTGMFGMGTVICSELYRQGKMPYDVYLKDMQYGYGLSQSKPEVIEGYHLLAKPVVKLMKKSKLFSEIIKYPALSWANHIAGIKPSLFGILCQTVGESVCGLVGKMLYKVRRLYV
jgi:hypothetical protein